jgi:hypothetical protein
VQVQAPQRAAHQQQQQQQQQQQWQHKVQMRAPPATRHRRHPMPSIH